MASHGQLGPHTSAMEGHAGPFGYYPDNIIPNTAPRNSILNSDEQALMESFWKSPSAMTQPGAQDALTLDGFTMNEKGADIAEFGFGGDGGDYTAGLGIEGGAGGDSYGGGFSHLGSSSYHDMFSDSHNDISIAQQPESEGQAASALMNMSHYQHQQNSHNNQSSGVWGSFVGPTGLFTGPMQQNSANTSSSTATPTTPTQPHVSQLSRQMHAQPLYTRDFMQPPAEKSSSTNPHARRASSQLDMRHMPAGQQQLWHAPQSPAHNGQAGPPMHWGSDNSFNGQGFQRQMQAVSVDKSRNLLQGLNVGNAGHGAVPSHASMSFPQVPDGHARARQQSGQRMSVPNNLQALGVATSVRHNQERPTINTALHNYPGHWPANSAMNNNIPQPSRKRSHSESEGHVTSQGIAPPVRRGPTLPKQESFDDPSNQASLMTPPGSTKRRRSNAARQDTGSSASSPTTPADSTGAVVLKRKRTDPKQSRANLSDAQKRSNHIASEQKRRDAMKTNFSELNMMVPSLHQGTHGLSRSDILQRAADYLEMLTVSNKALLQTYGISDSALSDDEDGGEEEEEADDDVGYIARGNAEGVTTYG